MGNRCKKDPPGMYIGMISRYLNFYINRGVASLGLNKIQVEILGILYLHPGISQNDLREKMLLDKITVTKNLKNLLEKGYVEKSRGEDDRRYKKLYLTDRAKEIGGEVREVLNGANEILMEGLSEEEKKISRETLKKMAKNIYRCVEDIR